MGAIKVSNKSSVDYIDKINNITDIYYQSTGINCQVIKLKGMDMKRVITSGNIPGFCNLVQCCKRGKDDCCKSYVYGARQAEKLGEYYIYFCPYGLINWAVPIMIRQEIEYFAIGGPTLMHPVDDLLIENIYKQNPGLQEKSENLKEVLNKIPFVDPVRTRYLAELLLHLSKGIDGSTLFVEKKQKYNMSAHLAETIHELKDKNKENQNNRYPIEKEKQLISMVKSCNNEGARVILNQLLGHIYFNNGNNFDIVKSKSIELMAVLARAAIEIGADLEIIFGLEYMLYEDISNVKDINELSIGLTKILDRFIESTFLIGNVKNKDIIYKAMNYIRNNYYNKDITLNDVADEVGLSNSYFSKLFKESVGTSYTDYLNKVRVAASKELLKKDITISEIAQAVGFNDQSYFSKVFKKIEGVTPGNFV